MVCSPFYDNVCCIYLNCMMTETNGHITETDWQISSLENASYVCGKKFKGRKLCTRHILRYSDLIKSYYRNLNTGTKGGRITTKDICAPYFINDDVVSLDDIQ